MERKDEKLRELGERLRQEIPKEMPVFPEHLISSVKKRMRWDIWENDVESVNDKEYLYGLMFQHPDASFFLFREESAKRSANSGLFANERIRTVETQRHWFEHPLYPNNFVRINPDPRRDWEKEAIETGTPLLRLEVVMSDYERRRRSNAETADAILSAMTPSMPATWYQRLSYHYQKHSVMYYAGGTALAIVGIAVSL